MAPVVESFPVFFPLPWADVSLAVLEVHVGSSLVFCVEGQQAVLPAWYTSHSQKKPYVSWMLNKSPAPFQVRRGQGLQGQEMEGGKVTVEGVLMVPVMGGRLWCPLCDAHDGMTLVVPMQGRCPQWASAHDRGNHMVAHSG